GELTKAVGKSVETLLSMMNNDLQVAAATAEQAAAAAPTAVAERATSSTGFNPSVFAAQLQALFQQFNQTTTAGQGAMQPPATPRVTTQEGPRAGTTASPRNHEGGRSAYSGNSSYGYNNRRPRFANVVIDQEDEPVDGLIKPWKASPCLLPPMTRTKG
ncbi:hypothetical protein KEM55_005788, partial [Ascosphaera atra]